MKVGVMTLMAGLLFAWPAFAGTDVCGPVDTDNDSVYDLCDNCYTISNPTQTDADSDGYGNICDCDYNQNNLCDGPDFVLFGQNFGKAVPPAPAVVDQNDSGVVDGPDFVRLGLGFGSPPGPSCGNPPGTPCP